MLSNFKWYRKWRGGHWEYWFVEPFLMSIDPAGCWHWVKVPKCHLLSGCTNFLCGHIQCEDYSGRPITIMEEGEEDLQQDDYF